VQVRCNEGVAIRIGPESCVCIREGADEALTGERIGQPWSRESLIFPEADVVRITEGDMEGCAIASASPLRRGRRPWHMWKLFAREPGDLGFDRRLDTVGPHREGEEP
jgi:hypothetical protein